MEEKHAKVVLVVDDEAPLLFVLEQMLADGGHRAIGMTDPRKAVEIYRERQNEIDLVISDMTMPAMSGDQLFRKLRAINPTVKMLIISGYLDQKIEQQLRSEGLFGFIDKPFKSAQVFQFIDRI